MKKRKRFVALIAGIMAAILLLTLIIGLLPTSVSAASSSEIRKQINELKEQKKDIQQQIDDLKEQYEQNESEIANIVARKNIIDQEVGLLHAQITNITEQISAFSVLVADKQDELDNAQARFEQMNDECKTRIRAMEEEGSMTYWEVLFKATSFTNLLDRLNMVEEIAASDMKRLQELSDAADAVETSRQELAEEKLELDETKAELDETNAQMEQKRKEADELLQELIAHAAELESLQEEKEKEDEELLAQIAQMEEEYNRAKEEEWLAYIATATTAATEATEDSGGPDFSGGDSSDSGGSDSGSSTGGSTSWIVPCNYIKVSSPFGLRNQPTAGASTYHQGIDLAANAGTTIVASRSGTVTMAGYSSSLGYYVTVNHGDGYSSLYAHMQAYAVSSGTSVSAGQTIGYVGSTGISTGNHLHFAILYNGAYQNPASYVSFY